MSRITNPCWVISCALLLGWAGSAMAGDTGVVRVDSSWVAADGRLQVRQTPAHNVLLHINGVAEDGVLRVDCYASAYKKFRRGEFKPRKRAKFEWTSDVLCPSGLEPPPLGFQASEFLTFLNTGAGSTDSTGVGNFTVTVQLPPSHVPQNEEFAGHDHIFLTMVRFVKGKGVVRTEAGCTISREPL